MDELDDTRPVPQRSMVASSIGPAVAVTGDTVVTARDFVALIAPVDVPRTSEAVAAAVMAAVDAALPADSRQRQERYYSLRLGDRSEVVVLDLPARIGRAPAAPRISTAPAARLVRVDSPLHEVSATHLDLRQVGASVVITDLRSTNGSVISQPGMPSRKLREGESVVVPAGTLVDIGDGNILQVLPMRQLDEARKTGSDDRNRTE